jgi:hypothetical protein
VLSMFMLIFLVGAIKLHEKFMPKRFT